MSVPSDSGTMVIKIDPAPRCTRRAGADFLDPPLQPDEIGRLGNYRVLKVLGTGGMGVVLLAEDELLGRHVAVKVLKPDLARDDEYRRRFLREARLTARVEHPHVVPVYQTGSAGGVPFLVMPYLKGETLERRLARAPRLTATEAVRIARETAEGLGAAHAIGLVHRDVKPSNLWLDAASGAVRVLDFGIACRPGDARLTGVGVVVGTPAYMAPEQATAGATVDERCDLFGLGVVLYEMLVGARPFAGTDTLTVLKSLATQEPRPIREVNPDVPPGVAEVVRRLLDKNPEQRFQSAGEVVAALSSEGVVRPAGRRPARRPLTAAAAVVAVAAGVLGWLATRGSTSVGAPPAVAADEPPAVARRPDLPAAITNALDMKLRLIPAGRFVMGSSDKEIERAIGLRNSWPPEEAFRAEGPAREVRISKPFYAAVHEVTEEQFGKFVAATRYRTEAEFGVGAKRFDEKGDFVYDFAVTWRTLPHRHGPDHPVVAVSYNDALAFCRWLSRIDKRTYALPTEAQWEYACRAGTTTRYWSGDAEPSLQDADNVADENTDRWLPEGWAAYGGRWNDGHWQTAPVGSYRPNAFGLCDLHGNAGEWCLDWYDADSYKTGPAVDPAGPASGVERVVRGGSWNTPPFLCRSANRMSYPPTHRDWTTGFRVVCVAE